MKCFEVRPNYTASYLHACFYLIAFVLARDAI